jgi:hypothetical protein
LKHFPQAGTPPDPLQNLVKRHFSLGVVEEMRDDEQIAE